MSPQRETMSHYYLRQRSKEYKLTNCWRLVCLSSGLLVSSPQTRLNPPISAAESNNHRARPIGADDAPRGQARARRHGSSDASRDIPRD